MELLFVSDLHISSPSDPMYLSLLNIITQRALPGDIVFLAGDVFELFIGNKQFYIRRYESFFEALRSALARGVVIHYIEGNHDFLLKKSIGSIAGIQLHAHHVEVELENKRFYVAHGDTVDSSDFGYFILRAFLRSVLMRGIAALFPALLLDEFGKYLSKKTGTSRPRLPIQLPYQHLERLRKVYRNYAAEKMVQGFDFVVLGHCHDLDEMYFNVGGRVGQYVNIGYPRSHGSFLSWTVGEEKIQRERLPASIFIK